MHVYMHVFMNAHIHWCMYVCLQDGTDKTRWGRKHGKAVVGTDWLRACAVRWARAPESEFAPPPSGDVRVTLTARAGPGGKGITAAFATGGFAVSDWDSLPVEFLHF